MPSAKIWRGVAPPISRPSNVIVPLVERQHAADRFQRRRLAGAIRADQRDEFALLDLDRDIAQRRHCAVADSDILKL